jgi:alpha-tubulin suppressor-like RCC1 family protein
VKSDGSVWCWGLNGDGQLGDNTTTDRHYPVQVKGPGGSGTLSGAASAEGGEKSTCAAKSDGTVWCWGRNDNGQLGDNTTTDRTAPVQVKGTGGSGTLTGVDSIAIGLTHVCAAKSDGTVWCWGRNDKGQLGDTTTTDRSAPVQVKGPGGSGTFAGAIAIGAGDSHSCAADSDGYVWCWGLNNEGQLGGGSTSASSTPRQVL